MEEAKKPMTMIERMRLQAQNQQAYGNIEKQEAKVDTTACPNCGAGRAKYDGITKCAYCNFVFTDNELTDGINITKEDNSR